MRKLVLALLCCVVAQSVAADVTLTGSANGSKDAIWEWVPSTDGQVLTSLSWKSKSANLFVLIGCSDGNELLIFALGLADGNDRFQRTESGHIGGFPCAIGVASRKGGSKFTLHIVGADDVSKSAIGGSSFRPARAQDFPGLKEKLKAIKALPR